jgi:cobalt-zinc-cadmium resistance protein CzcA
MIRGLVDFALNNRFLIILGTLLLLIWGAISFHNLPVEAYPDVANNYVQVITQWPGRAAEEVEQQVTIPLETVMNGIPHLEHLRSTSLFGLSSLMLIFDDESENDTNRQKVLERLSQVTLPAGLQPQMGTDWSPVGQIYWYSGGCGQLRRNHQGVPGPCQSRETGLLRPEPVAGRAAAGG